MWCTQHWYFISAVRRIEFYFSDNKSYQINNPSLKKIKIRKPSFIHFLVVFYALCFGHCFQDLLFLQHQFLLTLQNFFTPWSQGSCSEHVYAIVLPIWYGQMMKSSRPTEILPAREVMHSHCQSNWAHLCCGGYFIACCIHDDQDGRERWRRRTCHKFLVHFNLTILLGFSSQLCI